MTGKVSIIVPISSSDYEILKTLDKHCLMVANIKPLLGKNILLEIEAFTKLDRDIINN